MTDEKKNDGVTPIPADRGMNPRELEIYRTVSPEEWAQALKGYDEWRIKTRVISSGFIWFAAPVVVLATVTLFLYFEKWWIVVIGATLLAALAGDRGYCVGIKQGFISGYDSGFYDGINKVFGITPEMDEQLSKMAQDAELNEVLCSKDSKTDT